MTFYLAIGIPGGIELWIILGIFLLLFGHRIPSMARAMGSGITEFKKGLKSGPKDGDAEADDADAVGPGDGGAAPKAGGTAGQNSGSANG